MRSFVALRFLLKPVAFTRRPSFLKLAPVNLICGKNRTFWHRSTFFNSYPAATFHFFFAIPKKMMSPIEITELQFFSALGPGTDAMILKIFLPKNSQKIGKTLAFLT
jgi:hypothetical protein